MQEEPSDVFPSRNFEPRIYGVGAWTPHLFFGYDLVAMLRPRVLVELGTDLGESYFTFCQATAENNTGTRCFAVDTWLGDEQSGRCDEATFTQVAAHNREYYDKFSKLVRGTFDEARDFFRDESIDLIHFDGLHSEEAVRHDLTNWLPKLRPGGVVLMHDVLLRRPDFGVWKIWSELSERGRSWTFEDEPGLGVWQNPPNELLPGVLEVLFSDAEHERAELLKYYGTRTAQLRERIAREWRDGTVHRLPFLQQTTIQAFFSEDGAHREENAVNVRIGHDGWKNLSLTSRRRAEAKPLRIDFMSPLTIIEIASLRLRRGSKSFFHATHATDFDVIHFGADVERLPHPTQLRLKITGIDPQLYLPPFDSDETDEALVLEMQLRVEPGNEADDR